VLIAPDGRPLVSTKRQVRITNPKIARFVSMADAPFRACGLTAVCLSCGETPRMANHPQDAVWRVECSCTVRTLVPPGVH
jgi:hypothetical protein